MSLLLFGLLVAITIALFLVPGVGLLAVIPLVGAVAVGVWLVLGFAGRVPPSRAARKTRRPGLLGPGGPDDPDAGL
jgi:hypothetical protein